MKKNMIMAMDRLEIDENVRGLVRTLWKHGYRTLFSCEGHPSKEQAESEGTFGLNYREEPECRYVTFQKGSGDGWFEKNAGGLGFTRFLDHKIGIGKGKRDCISYYSPNRWYGEEDFPDNEWRKIS